MPSSIILMTFPEKRRMVPPLALASQRGPRSLDAAEQALQVRGRVNARGRHRARDRAVDAVAVGERAQLLQRLETLDRGRHEPGVAPEKGRAIGVDADVAIDGESGR